MAEDLALALVGTREAWEAWWYGATDVELRAVGPAIRACRDAGVTAGGLGCCGTTGAWHRPWCLVRPHEHEEAHGV